MKLTRSECHDYWMTGDGAKTLPDYVAHAGNEQYTEFVAHKFIKKIKKRNYNILELGCNVGRNLDALYRVGFTNLAGIDINPDMPTGMYNYYPNIYHNCSIITASIEDQLPSVGDENFDVVFSVAVLQHLHPDSGWVFEQIRRITKRYIFTIEYESPTEHPRIWGRNYREIFTHNDDFKMVESKNIDIMLPGYVYRLFRRR